MCNMIHGFCQKRSGRSREMWHLLQKTYSKGVSLFKLDP